MLISIIAPVRNEADAIPHLLRSFLGQTVDHHEVELLVVDGQSTDGTIDVLQRELAAAGAVREDVSDGWIFHKDESTRKVRLLLNPSRFVSQALNRGVSLANGEIILRWDAHTEYASDYVIRCIDVLESSDAWNVGGPARTKAMGCMQRAIAAAYHSPFSVGGARFHDPNYEGYVDTVTYGCWRKRTLLELGGFDEELVRNQDDELNLRIIRAGGKIYQTPRIRSWYHPRSSLGALFRQYLQYGFWKVRVIRKHRIPASPRHLVPVVFVLGLFFGAALSVFVPTIAIIYTAVLALYGLLLAYYSLRAAFHAGWDLLPLLLVTFLVYHISYGIGFLSGLLDFLRPGNKRKAGVLFSSLSR